MRITVLVITLLAMSACVVTPRDYYEEMEQEIVDAKLALTRVPLTEKELKKATKRLAKAVKKRDTYEKNIPLAEAFYANKKACDEHDKTMWFCVYRGIHANWKTPPRDDFELVRRYKMDKTDCGCSKRDDVVRFLQGRQF